MTYFLFTIVGRCLRYPTLVLDPCPPTTRNLQLDNKTTWILGTTAVTRSQKPQNSVWFSSLLGLSRGWLAFSVHSPPPVSTIPIPSISDVTFRRRGTQNLFDRLPFFFYSFVFRFASSFFMPFSLSPSISFLYVSFASSSILFFFFYFIFCSVRVPICAHPSARSSRTNGQTCCDRLKLGIPQCARACART